MQLPFFDIPAKVEIPVHLLGTLFLLLAVLTLRVLLDLEVATWLIRALHWVPTRAIFRHKYPRIDGSWEHIWDGDFGRFSKAEGRHGNHTNFQLFRWVYAATRSQGRVFTAFGRIQGDYLIGRWYDQHDDLGYFGAFQLRIVDGDSLDGIWTGHSKQNPALIRNGTWKWTKLDA